ncbi:unnamed protein product [Lampetra planeri]
MGFQLRMEPVGASHLLGPWRVRPRSAGVERRDAAASVTALRAGARSVGPRCTSPWARRERWWGQQPRAVQGWREVAGRLDLLLVAVTQLSLLLGMTTAPPAEATDHAMGTRRNDRADDGRRCCRGGACVVVGRHCTSGGARAGCGCHRPHGRGQTSTDRYSHVAEPTGSPTTTLHATEAVQLPATIFHAVESALAGVAIAHATETAWSKATIFPAGEGA